MYQVRDLSDNKIKYSGRSKAIVEDNVDPQKRGRIKINHPLIGDDSVWVPYLTAPNMFSVPRIGDIVYVEADAGYSTHPVAWGNFTKKGGGAVPDEFLRSEPTNMGMYSPNNHLIELDDGKTLAQADNGVRITTSLGNKFHMFDDVTKQSIVLEDIVGNVSKLDSLAQTWTWDMVIGTNFTIDGTSDALSMTAAFGDTLSVSALDGIQASTPSGTSLSMKNGEIALESLLTTTVTGTAGVLVEEGVGASLNLATGQVALGNATLGIELLDLIDQFVTEMITVLTTMATSTHIGNLGYPTLPPTEAASYIASSANLAANVKAQLALIKGSF